jgi:hypothetical protein
MKLIYTLLLISLVNFVNAQSGLSWSPVIDISTSSIGNQHPRIVTDAAGKPMVIWGKVSTNEIYFSRWDDTSFTAPVIINPTTHPAFVTSWAGPDIASFGDTVYVVYKKIPEDSNHIYLQRSFDAGLTFSSPIQVDSLVDSLSRFPAVTTDSIGNPIVAFMRFDIGFINPVYVVSRSNNFGSSFNANVVASMYSGGFVCECCPAAIVSSGNKAAMLYRDNFFDFRTIWSGVSTDNCATFPFGMPVDNTTWMINACPSSGPDGVIIGDSVYTVFMSGAYGDAACYLNSSSIISVSSGPTFQLLDSIGGPISNQNFPRIANTGNKVSIVCRQTNNGTGQLAFYYTQNITQGLSRFFDPLASGSVSNSDVTMSDSAAFVVWQDDNTETVKYRKGVLPSTTSIQKLDNQSGGLLIYPSPVKNDFKIKLKSIDLFIESIEISDLAGRKVPFTFSNLNYSTDCKLLYAKSGIYIVKVIDSVSNVHFSKIIISN